MLANYFYVLVLLGVIGVLLTRQTIYSLLYLVVVFVSSAVLWVSLGVELIGLILIIVYIGAITMLLLYMVMFLDSKRVAEKSEGFSYLERLGGSLILIFIYLGLPQNLSEMVILNNVVLDTRWLENLFLTNDIGVIAMNLFEQHSWAVIMTGFILLVAMLIALDITSTQKTKVISG